MDDFNLRSEEFVENLNEPEQSLTDIPKSIPEEPKYILTDIPESSSEDIPEDIPEDNTLQDIHDNNPEMQEKEEWYFVSQGPRPVNHDDIIPPYEGILSTEEIMDDIDDAAQENIEKMPNVVIDSVQERMEETVISQGVLKKVEPAKIVENVEEYPVADVLERDKQELNYNLEEEEANRQNPEWLRRNKDRLVKEGLESLAFSGSELFKQTNPHVEVIDGVRQELNPSNYESKVISEYPDFYTRGEFLEQGKNRHGYLGTCGETTIANTLNRIFKTNMFTEDNVLTVALSKGLCNVNEDLKEAGSTTTQQFLDIYDQMDKELGGNKINVECYDYTDALPPERVAELLDEGKIVNVAVDAGRLWDLAQNYVDKMGAPVDQIYSDHWIVVNKANRNGNINTFNILDSGGGKTNVSLNKYREMCFGSKYHKVLDPTVVVVYRNESPVDDA